MPAVTIRPVDGGRLITRADAAAAGLQNYVTKRGFRRVSQTDEALREGHDYFRADGDDPQLHPFPGDPDDPVTLIHHVRRTNGESAIVAGTKDTLYRFNTDLSGYVDGHDGQPYIATADTYFEAPTRWQVIGSGYSANGRRWEAVDQNGSTVFNNGVDLPVEFRIEWRHVRPLYELREQGILSVGTIAQTNDILLCGDVRELRDSDVQPVLGVVRSGTIKVSQAGFRKSGTVHATTSGAVMTASASFFVPTDEGKIIRWSNGVESPITAYSSATAVQIAGGISVTSGLSFVVTTNSSGAAYDLSADGDWFTEDMVGTTIGLANGQVRRIVSVSGPRAAKTDTDYGFDGVEAFAENPKAYDRWDTMGVVPNHRQYRVIWGEIGAASRFAVQIAGVANAGSNVLTLNTACRSIVAGDAVSIIRGGINGGTAAVTVGSIAPGVASLSGLLSSSNEASMIRTDAIGSTAGYDDLIDDGSGILKMGHLQGRIIVYKDTDIFVGRYTGDPNNPFSFERRQVPHGWSLHYRNTLVSVRGTQHIFAGRNRMLRFDLTSLMPQPVPDADVVENLFFDHARIEDAEDIFATDNKLTGEIWFVSPASPADKVIAFDYVYGTFSTADLNITAAVAVKDVAGPLVRETTDWFLMGTPAGEVLQYGLCNRERSDWATRSIFFQRSGRPYTTAASPCVGTLKSGMGSFGDEFNEKVVDRYVLRFSSQQGEESPSVSVTLSSWPNPSAPEAFIGTVDVVDADYRGMIPVHAIDFYFSDEINVVATSEIRITSKTWSFNLTGSGSWGKS